MNRMKFLKIITYSLVELLNSNNYLEAKELEKKDINEELFLKEKIRDMYNKLKNDEYLKKSQELLVIIGDLQKLYFINQENYFKSYTISTGRGGFGNSVKSGQSPTGLHKIIRKIGNNLPEGAIIKKLRPTTMNYMDYSRKTPLITSRVLVLEGLEEQNNNSISRSIYIHGTNLENLLGYPVSAGCIRMANKDVIELYEQTKEGSLVNILPNQRLFK